MSFYVELKDGRHFEWYINSKPFNYRMNHITDISVLQADGDELEFIIQRIRNIPYSYHICRWRDYLAQFIYENIGYESNRPNGPLSPIPPGPRFPAPP